MSEYCHIEWCEKPAHLMLRLAEVPLCPSHARKAYLAVKDMADNASDSTRSRTAGDPKRGTRLGWRDESGFVYFIDCGPDLIKIGWSQNPPKRLREIGGVKILATIPGTQQDEKAMHMRWGATWSHNEYFHATPELLAFIASLSEAA